MEVPGYYGEQVQVLQLAKKGLFEKGVYGWRFPYGSTGMISLGDGNFYFSEDFYEEGQHGSRICLYRYTGEAERPFEKI